MAALLLFRQGRARALKTMLLEGQVFPGLGPTASLSAESGKSDKGLPPNSKKPSSPKNVVDPKERGKLLTTPAAAELSRNMTAPSSYPSAGTRGGAVANPRPEDDVPLADTGVRTALSRKAWAALPQKGPSALGSQGSRAGAPQKSGGVAGSSSSSSSASSSSSSDSGSDEEGDGPATGLQVMSKGRGGVPRPGASHSFENRAPKISASARETAWSARPHQDLTSPEGPRQAKKKGASMKPSKVRKDEPKSTISKSQVDKEFMKGKKMQKIFSSDTLDKESQRPSEGTGTPSDPTKPGASAQLSGGPAPTRPTEGAAVGRRLQAAPPKTRGRQLAEQGPEPTGAVAFSPFKKENLGRQVIEGISKAEEEILEDQGPITNSKPAPVQNAAMFDEKTAEIKLEAKSETAEDTAAQAGGQDGTQEPVQAASAAEPFDNTTYKNLQHHDYTAYTFLDLNLDLSRFRMPQPSSGRESPRH